MAHDPNSYPPIKTITAFAGEEFDALAHGGSDGSMSSTMVAFAVGLLYGKFGARRGYDLCRALDASIRLAPATGDSTRLAMTMAFLQTHGAWSPPTRKRRYTKEEKEAILHRENWTCVSREADADDWYPPNEVGQPTRYTQGRGVTLEHAWRTYQGSVQR